MLGRNCSWELPVHRVALAHQHSSITCAKSCSQQLPCSRFAGIVLSGKQLTGLCPDRNVRNWAKRILKSTQDLARQFLGADYTSTGVKRVWPSEQRN